MPGRRIVALFVALLTLHLSVIGADLACAQHANGGMHAARATEHGMAMPQHAVASHVDDTSDMPPCQTPALTDCCRAMTSCAVNFAFVLAHESGDRTLDRQTLAGVSARTPLGPSMSPEPPPPKA